MNQRLEISDNEHNLQSPALPTELSVVIVSLHAHVLVAFTMLCTKLQAIIFWYALQKLIGGLAQVVERSICIREAPGSIPGFSTFLEALFSAHAWKMYAKRQKFGDMRLNQ